MTSCVLLKEPNEFDAKSVREQERHELENLARTWWGTLSVYTPIKKLMQSVFFPFREIIRECSYSFMLGRIISLRSYCCKLERSCSLLLCNYSSRYLRIILMFIITTFDVCKLSFFEVTIFNFFELYDVCGLHTFKFSQLIRHKFPV